MTYPRSRRNNRPACQTSGRGCIAFVVVRSLFRPSRQSSSHSTCAGHAAASRTSAAAPPPMASSLPHWTPELVTEALGKRLAAKGKKASVLFRAADSDRSGVLSHYEVSGVRARGAVRSSRLVTAAARAAAQVALRIGARDALWPEWSWLVSVRLRRTVVLETFIRSNLWSRARVGAAAARHSSPSPVAPTPPRRTVPAAAEGDEHHDERRGLPDIHPHDRYGQVGRNPLQRISRQVRRRTRRTPSLLE